MTRGLGDIRSRSTGARVYLTTASCGRRTLQPTSSVGTRAYSGRNRERKMMPNRHWIGRLACALGAALMLAGLSACGGKSTTAPVISPSKAFYVVNYNSTVTLYAAGANGN